MKKIKTLFVRDSEDRRYVTPQVEPGCEWVVNGEGTATRKFDGTCVRFDGAQWWARREVKAGKSAPVDFVPEQHDHTTGKTVGWEPAANSAFATFIAEAVEREQRSAPGTYELCGPKVNGNPEGFPHHVLVTHGAVALDAPRDFDGLRTWLSNYHYEGIVWHHPDGRMVKIKKRDFRGE